MIKVSIVVPVFNAEPFLRECMDSLRRQTLKEIEIVCVNDGSSDHSLQILEKYAARDTRIRVLDHVNSGYGHAVNAGMDEASGKYIGIVEPDDYVHPRMYQRLYELAENMNLDIIKADFCRVYDKNGSRKIERVRLSGNAADYGRICNPRRDIRIFKLVMNTWTGIYKREFLKNSSIRHHETPGASFQDLSFWFQSFCKAERIYFLNEPFYMYRMDNPNSSIHDRSKVYAVCGEYEFMHQFLEQNPELKSKYLLIYSWKRFHDYQFTLGRIGRERRKEFLWRFHRDFRKAEERNELSRRYFTVGEWKMLRTIIDTPEKYLKSIDWYVTWYKVEYYKEYYGIKPTLARIIENIIT